MAVHNFHIPVMGTGHSIDTPIRVAPFGISSVISLVDDLLLEPLRKKYCKDYNLAYEPIPRFAEDGRAKRITAYLDMVHDVVQIRFKSIQNQAFETGTDKTKYFEMLPDTSSLKKEYEAFNKLPAGPEKEATAVALTERMECGFIDVNIMVKLDRVNYDRKGELLSDEYADAKAALRGYAKSKLDSCIVFSAGINQTLFSYMTQFSDFYRNEEGYIKKRIILKVSDYRSTLTQGKFLARKGLEVYEFRIESGLNCGGHAFASNGYLLPTLLEEFVENRAGLKDSFLPSVKKFYDKQGWSFPETTAPPRLTVQGGIGNYGENQRLMDVYGMDATGWASPFLLVPEATPIDGPTKKLLAASTPDDLYLSDVSPLGVPFNNIRNSGSEQWTTGRVEQDKAGSPCPKGFLVSNHEYTEKAICTASRQYQKQKLEDIEALDATPEEKAKLKDKTVVKTCICDHLGNGALITLDLAKVERAPQAICPGSNIAWFNREYTLREMVAHIYGQGDCLVPKERPHMFEKEISMYIDHYRKSVEKCASDKEALVLRDYRNNLQKGIEQCTEIAQSKAYEGENLESILASAPTYLEELDSIYNTLESQFAVVSV
jgi:hypothetical protein